MPSTLRNSLLAAALLACSCAQALTIYDVTLTTSPVAVANPNVDNFFNCLAAEGCMGRDGTLVDVPGGNLPDALPFTFALSAAQVAAITGGVGVTGTFTVVASRDIGHKVGAPADDFIEVSADSFVLGDLFKNTIDTCPAGERGFDYSATLVCGPNFHTDVTASDFLSLTAADLKTFAADGSIQFFLDPTDKVGRLKIFSVELVVSAVPEPGPLALYALGLAVVGMALRIRR
jgi:hypothetical protein